MAISLAPSAGPDQASSSTPRVGLFPDHPVWRYDLGAGPHHGDGQQVLARDIDTAPGDGLRIALFPRLDMAGDLPRYQAREVELTIVLDGVEHPLIDQHGVPSNAGGRFRFCDQWNLIELDLATWAGRRIDAVLLRSAQTSGHGWVQWLGAAPLVPESSDVVARVRTARGSHNGSAAGMSRGNTFPITCLPHGMHLLTPLTDARTRGWLYSWHGDVAQPSARPRLQALAFCHQPSPWIADRLGWQVMPFTGTPIISPAARAIEFDHQAETDQPHHYALTLADGTRAEMTPTMRAAVFRFRFASSQERGVILDQPGDGDLTTMALPDGRLAFSGRIEAVRGWRDEHPAPTGFFWGCTRQPVAVTRPGGAQRPGLPRSWQQARRALSGLRPGAPRPQAAVLSLLDGDELELAVAISFISVDQARRCLDTEVGTASFDEIAQRAHDAWAEILSRLEITGGSPEARTQAWSNLARLYCWPNVHHENLGTESEPQWAYATPFRGAQKPASSTVTGSEVISGPLMVNNGYWDTYRTCWPMYHLLSPRASSGLLNGILGQYRDSGWMSRWSAPGHVDCMVGTSSDAVFADAAAHGVEFDQIGAYDSALRNASTPPSSRFVGRTGIERGRFTGWIDTSVPEGFSWSMENANCDAAIAIWSARLAHQAENLGVADRAAEFRANATWFTHRAKAWRALFDDWIGFGQGRRADGSWRLNPAEFDPRIWGHDWTETNAWGMAFAAPFDGARLAEFYGGEAGLAAKLDEALATPETANPQVAGSYSSVIHEMTEARNLDLGMVAISNQPAHHTPFMYAFTGQHHRTQALTRQIAERLFVGSVIGQGYPGDEDNGEMSAWWLFAALGLYPLSVGSGELVLTTPVFERISLLRDNGHRLTVTCSDPALTTITAVQVNGEPWDQVTIPVELLARDLIIEVTTGAEPTGWAADSRPRSLPGGAWYPDLTGAAAARLVRADGTDHPTQTTSDLAATEVLGAGDGVEVTWTKAITARFVTLTTADATPVRVEIGLEGHGQTIVVDHRPQWADQTMAHLLGDDVTGVHRVRFTFPQGGRLRQIEVY